MRHLVADAACRDVRGVVVSAQPYVVTAMMIASALITLGLLAVRDAIREVRDELQRRYRP